MDVAILGALQVDEQGYIANWAIPWKNIMGVGGAMDLLSGANKIIVTTNHTSKNGDYKNGLFNNNKEIERIEKRIDQRHLNEISKNNMDLIKLLNNRDIQS